MDSKFFLVKLKWVEYKYDLIESVGTSSHTNALSFYCSIFLSASKIFMNPAMFSRIFLACASKKDCFYESHQAMTCLVPSHFKVLIF